MHFHSVRDDGDVSAEGFSEGLISTITSALLLTKNQLRPPCIELSSVALRFRGQQASIKSLLQALDTLHTVLVELGQLDALDEKLAEYAFFPLSNVFNESQRLSSRCLEVAVQSLHILVSGGWRQKLQPDMGKQLLILLSLLAGGSPARPKDILPSEELICACFECMDTLFDCLGQAEQHIFNETGASTIVDQSVYLLLEAIVENASENVHLSAATALQTLLSQINSRIVLASLLPRTVSALTKASKATTQRRRSHKVQVAILGLLGHILQAVLADEVALDRRDLRSAESEISMHSLESAEESTTLDEKWLKATASQVKLALANVVKLRNHNRLEVQHALFKMCLMICERCSKSLSDSLQLILETMVMLANHDEASPSDRERQAVKHLVLANTGFADLMKNSLDAWINALPRLMQGNDDRPKRQVLRQISAAVQIFLESGDASDLLDDSLATSLVESVSTAADSQRASSIHKISDAPFSAPMIHFHEYAELNSFETIILDQRSQSDSLVELRSLISSIKKSAASEPLTRSIMARIGHSSGTQQFSALWLSLNFLRQDESSFPMSDLVDFRDDSFDTTPYLLSDLYSIALPLLLDSSMISTTHDWRISALALESTILQANQLGKSYRPELIDTLYPILSFLGSSHPRLQSHAMTALNLLATACEYPSTSAMLVANVDYLINSIALKFNTFDISPQGPQVLLMLLRLCGARLIPYLDDLIGSIFAALDNFHGYPRLVELLFEVLGVLVDEAAKNPVLSIANNMEEPKHRKTAYRPSTIEDILQDIRAHKKRKGRRDAEILGQEAEDDTLQSAPHRPWTSKLDGPEEPKQDPETTTSDSHDNNEIPSSHTEEEKEPPPLSKPHTLLLSIARSTIPHLASPSPHVRLTLLQLLSRMTPILSRHENSFLPLVNDIWPAILPRLFSLETRNSWNNSETEQPEDPAYVTITAADTITAICIGAGDFMSGRIEDIFPRLERLYKRVWDEVEQERQRMAQHRSPGTERRLEGLSGNDGSGANLRGTVDLRITQPPPAHDTNVHSPQPYNSNIDIVAPKTTTTTTNPPQPPRPQPPPPPHPLRTNPSQIHTSLTHLLSTLLTHTSLPPTSPIGDTILALLSPIMDEPGREEARDALEGWNQDAVWATRERMKMGFDRADKEADGKWREEGGERIKKPERVRGRNGEVWEWGDVVF